MDSVQISFEPCEQTNLLLEQQVSDISDKIQTKSTEIGNLEVEISGLIVEITECKQTHSNIKNSVFYN